MSVSSVLPGQLPLRVQRYEIRMVPNTVHGKPDFADGSFTD